MIGRILTGDALVEMARHRIEVDAPLLNEVEVR